MTSSSNHSYTGTNVSGWTLLSRRERPSQMLVLQRRITELGEIRQPVVRACQVVSDMRVPSSEKGT